MGGSPVFSVSAKSRQKVFNLLLVVVGTIDGLAWAGGRGRERGMWREVDYLLAGPILVHYLSPATSQVSQVGDPKLIREDKL